MGVYEIIATVVCGLFCIQFILSIIGADWDFDIDGDLDLGMGDIVSFKGLMHFLLGTVWLAVKEHTHAPIMWYDYIIAFLLGIFLMIALYFVYKFVISLKHESSPIPKELLVGQSGRVDLVTADYCIVTIETASGSIEVKTKYETTPEIGNLVTIKEFKNGLYYI